MNQSLTEIELDQYMAKYIPSFVWNVVAFSYPRLTINNCLTNRKVDDPQFNVGLGNLC